METMTTWGLRSLLRRLVSGLHARIPPTAHVPEFPVEGLTREDQKVGRLARHLLQISLVCINTFMIQQMLAKPTWPGRLSLMDLRALAPLKWLHVNPHGTFILHLHARLPLAHAA